MQHCECSWLSKCFALLAEEQFGQKVNILAYQQQLLVKVLCFELSNHVTTCPFGGMNRSMHKGLKLMPEPALERGQKV